MQVVYEKIAILHEYLVSASVTAGLLRVINILNRRQSTIAVVSGRLCRASRHVYNIKTEANRPLKLTQK